jgi:hypothetical protein
MKKVDPSLEEEADDDDDDNDSRGKHHQQQPPQVLRKTSIASLNLNPYMF